MKFFQIHSFYSIFLNECYRDNPELAQASYEYQIQNLLDSYFSACHLWTPYIENSFFTISNNLHALYAWAKENGHEGLLSPIEILKAQIEKFDPDILYITNPNEFDSNFIRSLSKRPEKVIGWRAASIPDHLDWSEYDLILSNSSFCREKALKLGAQSVVDFSPGVLTHLKYELGRINKKFDLLFCGQWTREHQERNQLVYELCKRFPEKLEDGSFGIFIPENQTFPIPELIRKYNRGGVWGEEMYHLLKSTKIVLNAHIDIATQDVGNMRMFETIGVGSFLLSKETSIKNKYFEKGVEFESFRDLDELVTKINFFLKNEEKREVIAKNGFEKCFNNYSMENQTKNLLKVIGLDDFTVDDPSQKYNQLIKLNSAIKSLNEGDYNQLRLDLNHLKHEIFKNDSNDKTKFGYIIDEQKQMEFPKSIYHVHVRKTAGTSINFAFFSNVNKEDPSSVYETICATPKVKHNQNKKIFVGWDRDLINAGKYNYAFSHLPIHRLNLQPDTFTFTCLRDPVKRVVSLYNMLKSIQVNNIYHPGMKTQESWLGNSFDDFIQRVPKEELLNQIYMFSENLNVEQAAERILSLDQLLFTENLSSDLEMLQKNTGWDLPISHQKKQGFKEDISQVTLNILRNKLDSEYRLFEILKGECRYES